MSTKTNHKGVLSPTLKPVTVFNNNSRTCEITLRATVPNCYCHFSLSPRHYCQQEYEVLSGATLRILIVLLVAISRTLQRRDCEIWIKDLFKVLTLIYDLPVFELSSFHLNLSFYYILKSLTCIIYERNYLQVFFLLSFL